MELLTEKESAIVAYKPFYAELAEAEKTNSQLAFDYESKIGNKEARSWVYKLRQTKGALEKARKSEKAEFLRLGRAVDAEAQQIESRIEAMIAVHQVKIDEIEQRETDRVSVIKDRLAALGMLACSVGGSEDHQKALQQAESILIDDSWSEFVADAAKVKDATIQALKMLIADALKSEAEAAELKRLREEVEARAQKDRDDAIAKAAADKAIKDAEIKAAAEAEKARIALANAEAAARQQREDAERRELQLKLAAEQAERARLDAEKKAEQDKIEAARKAKQDAEDAVKREQERVFREAEAAAAEQKKREANQNYKRKINKDALDALVHGGIDADVAMECIKLIANGKVPNVSVNY